MEFLSQVEGVEDSDCRQLIPSNPEGFAVVDQADEGDMVAALVDELIPERHADILAAVYIYGQTFEDAGNRFGVTRQRAKAICKKSIHKLQSHISGC